MRPVVPGVLLALAIGIASANRQPVQAAKKSCDGVGVTKELLTTSDGAEIAAFVSGTGSVSVILVHQVNQDHCGWSAEARALSSNNTVVSIDLRGYGASSKPVGANALAYANDIAAAVAYARAKGANKVVVMGASMGASATVVAASQIDPPIDGAIAVSPPGNYKGQNAIAAAANVKVPILYVAAKDDGSAAKTTSKLDALSTASPNHRALIFAKGGHGWNLVKPASNADTQVREFIATIAKSSPP